MHSLRARLVAGLLALAAVGLLVLGGITYAEQRSFLTDRVDQQLRGAVRPVSAALGFGLRPPPGGRAGSPGEPGFGGGGPGFGLPEGTYGEHRDASGVVDATTVQEGYEEAEAEEERLSLPDELPLGRPTTVLDGAYRALAVPDPRGGGVNVVAIPLAETSRTLDRLLLVEALVIAAVLLALGLSARFLVRVGLLPLERMGRAAGAIAGGDLSQRVEPAEERTEVGRLGLALNAMLERLERAFAGQKASEDRLRRFLADASHELRTPLTSIRGYAELFRTGAARDPQEVEKAMRRIEQEAARMGVLVEDLLTLARLDELPASERVAVDLAALARDAVSDACATAPDREIALHAEGPPAAATVLGDPHQLAQVLANLLRNALVHTPAGTPIEVTLAREGEGARLEVRDHGPGLPPLAPGEDPDALFERFWRAEGGRARGAGGAGLGLAIVAGVVERHGGRVAAANAAGGGACFTVRLPLAPGPVSPAQRSGYQQTT
ncbi:MAG TPA: HAMP domain-containing sensor histidine kinase [Conexibacter sp.]|nr:HAMP domain-containing sensor histidine kinase [Conexibacter sp.]